MNIQTIITKKAGHLVPRSYLDIAVKNCPDCLGIAIQDNSGDSPILDVSAIAAQKSVDEIYKILEGCKDFETVVMLGKISTPFNKDDDVQPFVFQQASNVDGEDPQNILAIFLEGDFPKYCKPETGHSDEYNLWENFVYPSMIEKFEAADDLPDFYRRIASSQFQQMIMNTVGHRGVMAMLPLEGDLMAFGENVLGGEYDWGTTSNRFNWGDTGGLDKAAQAAVAAVKKTTGRLSQLMSSTTAEPAAQPEQKTNPPGVYNTQTNTEDDIWAKWPGTSSKTHQLMKPPTGLQGNARNRWIRTFLHLSPNDELPKGSNHKDFAIPVELELVGFAQETVSTNDQVKMLQNKVQSFQKGGKTESTKPAEQEQKTAPNVTPTAAPPSKESRPSIDFLPETPADEGLVAAELVTEWATNPKRPTALDVQRIESKWSKFTTQRGITLLDVARWSIAEKKEFTKKCPHDAARLISELMLKIHELGGVTEEKTVETKPAEKQVEVPSPQSQPSPTQQAPKPKGRLAQLTGAA